MADTKRLPWNLILGLGIPGLVFGVILFSAIGFLLLRVYDSERLHQAAARGDLTEVRDLLDREPWRLDKRNRGDMTPLHMAAHRDQGAVIKELARRGADINARWNQVASDDGDWTALYIAARRGKPEIVATLLQVGPTKTFGLGAAKRHRTSPRSPGTPQPLPCSTTTAAGEPWPFTQPTHSRHTLSAHPRSARDGGREVDSRPHPGPAGGRRGAGRVRGPVRGRPPVPAARRREAV